MSELLKHECGIAVLRLLKPPGFYEAKYGDPSYGLNRMQKLMHHQKHRGQDGAGIVSCLQKKDLKEPLLIHFRSATSEALDLIFKKLEKKIKNSSPGNETASFSSELYLGHLRYGTYGQNGPAYCHPFLNRAKNSTNTIAIAGNFNLTNMAELYRHHLYHPLSKAPDTKGILKIIARHMNIHLQQGSKFDLNNVLKDSCEKWDGGYVIAGIRGGGDAFVIRDAAGIRPAYYYHDDEIFVMASERYAIHEALHISYEKIKEINPGHVLSIDSSGNIHETRIMPPSEKKSCSFERIYFSHGDDPQIKKERNQLGAFLFKDIKNLLSDEIRDAIFSFVPQTAETAFNGLVEYMKTMPEFSFSSPITKNIFAKNTDLRLFISDEISRNHLLTNAFQNPEFSKEPERKNLVLIDDSIVRGNTLKHAVLKLLEKENLSNIIIGSTAPQLRYPDCYGIDIARIDELIAFRAAIALLKEKGRQSLIEDTYRKCLESAGQGKVQAVNHVKNIYKLLDEKEISKKIAQMIKPDQMQSELHIIFQSIEHLHKACPMHKGDWYFTGEYPSPGGNGIANQSFIHFIEGKNIRAY